MIALGLSTHAHFTGNVKSLFENSALPGALWPVSPNGLLSGVRRDRCRFTFLDVLWVAALAAALVGAGAFLITNGAAV
jgi:hypothetical protein